MFIGILGITIISQILIVTYGGIVFTIDPNGLSLVNWAICIAIGLGSLIVGFLIRVASAFEASI